MEIKIATTEAEILACFPVLVQLRPHLAPETFVDRVRRMERTGYYLSFIADSDGVKAVAGFRILDQFVLGRVLYVDDLITDAGSRSRGYGDKLFDWLADHARQNDCDHLELDSGVHRYDAHRFYFRKRMKILCYHFCLPLSTGDGSPDREKKGTVLI